MSDKVDQLHADIEAVDEPRERPHPCEVAGCEAIVPYDDEPYCLEHSDDSGSYVRGYSYRRKHADEN